MLVTNVEDSTGSRSTIETFGFWKLPQHSRIELGDSFIEMLFSFRHRCWSRRGSQIQLLEYRVARNYTGYEFHPFSHRPKYLSIIDGPLNENKLHAEAQLELTTSYLKKETNSSPW